LKWCGSAAPSSKNQRCTGVSGTSPVTGPCSATGAAACPTTAASSAMVWCMKTLRGVTRSPASLARAITWMERIESPPSEKKLSWIPTRSRRSTSAQTRASASSAGVVGAT
jgi:hypothetical protein